MEKTYAQVAKNSCHEEGFKIYLAENLSIEFQSFSDECYVRSMHCEALIACSLYYTLKAYFKRDSMSLNLCVEGFFRP